MKLRSTIHPNLLAVLPLSIVVQRPSQKNFGDTTETRILGESSSIRMVSVGSDMQIAVSSFEVWPFQIPSCDIPFHGSRSFSLTGSDIPTASTVL